MSREVVFAEYGEPTSQISNLESSLEGSLDSDIRDELYTPLQCARTREFKYVRAPTGLDRAYEITGGDPKETEVSVEEHTDLLQEIKQTLGENLSIRERGEIEQARKRNLRELGYI